MKKDEKIFTRLGRAVIFGIARFLMFAAFRTKVIYIDENGRKSRFLGPAVFICNHTHLCDGVLMTLLLQYNCVHALVAKDWFERKKVNWWLRQGRCIPIDRRSSDFSWIHNSMKVLGGGESIVMFPEGGISRTDDLKSFKSGFILLAEKANVPVIPICVAGKYKVFGKRQKVIVGKPFFPETFTLKTDAEDKKAGMSACAAEFRERIREMKTLAK